MMNLGRFVPGSATFNSDTPISIDTGLNLEYLRIINNSPYMLSLNFVGLGTIDYPEMYLEDIFLDMPGYVGKLIITPTANFAAAAINSALSTLVSINGYNQGELPTPQSQPLTTLSAVGNSLPISATATAVANDGNVSGTEFVEATPSGGGKTVSIENNGRIILTPDSNTVTGFEEDMPSVPVGDVITHKGQVVGDTARRAGIGIGADGFGILTLGDGTTIQLRVQAVAGGWKITHGTTGLDNGAFQTDGSGNVSGGNDTLRSGVQESGHFVMEELNNTHTDDWSIYIRFRKKMTNTPSSITFSSVTNTNTGAPSVSPGQISTDGFTVNFQVLASGTWTITFDWVTVGN